MVEQIIKRNGTKQKFNRQKIENAIKKSFSQAKITNLDEIIKDITDKVILAIDEKNNTVEHIQDIVEKTLIEKNYYQQAKSYILYRDKKAQLRQVREQLSAYFTNFDISKLLKDIEKDFPNEEYSLKLLLDKFNSFYYEGMDQNKCIKALIKASAELTSAKAPKWEFISSRIYLFNYYQNLKEELKKRNISSFTDKFYYFINNNLYGKYFLEHYSKQEVQELEKILDYSKDKLLTYSSVELLYKRYLVKDHSLVVLETPQEMFLAISMHLMMLEKDKMNKVKEFYSILSSLKVTMATPTIQNSRKPYSQLSSCFIDTVSDSLDGIFKSIDNFSKISKYGGGMGLYLGKIRALGSSIRGFKGASGGVIRWVRIINDVAVAVDQLGVRNGAVACYLDAWHKDLPEFLQIRTNNGDDRMKAHDVFPAICYPDLFWKLAKDNINATWYLFDPHEIYEIKGYHLEDYYGKEWESKYFECIHDERISKREFILKDLIRLIIKSEVETGTPFCFNRDIANKMNPNKHKGMIYCSNLCTEIAQNMSEIKTLNAQIKKDSAGQEYIEDISYPGDFVVCNLASLNLGAMDVNNLEEMEKVIIITIRALDNVIDLNQYPVPYAKITSRKYRPIGLGVSGYNHMLAKNLIRWESEQHLQFVDKVFENINYFTLKASLELAKEKGKYSLFEGSDFDNGDYFTLRNYTSERWENLKKEIHENGLRNGYLLAIAPTASTSIIAGTSAGLDPIMNKFFLEEKKGEIIPRVAPDLNLENFFIYKNAHYIDQEWTIKAGGIRSRHIDQASSMNLYISTDFSMRQILDLYIHAYEQGIKSIYYIRSKSLEVEECESCAN